MDHGAAANCPFTLNDVQGRPERKNELGRAMCIMYYCNSNTTSY